MIRISVSALLVFSLTFCRSPEENSIVVDKPNILWITCEDISPHLGCYGDSYANTPNLDQLASQGVVYLNAFATAPVCAVARSTIISGIYASSMGSQHMRCLGRRPQGAKLYPEILRGAGYYCTNNAKTDYNFDMDPKSIWDQCDQKAHWRNRTDQSQPFFSIFNLGTSHESRVNNADRYANAIRDLTVDQLKKPGEVPLPPYYPDTEDTRELWARYYNIITAMDQQVGSILAQLKEDGLEENTIVIFYSDHGAGIPRHKRWLYDSGIRVPMIVKVPTKFRSWLPHEQGSKTKELVSFIDLPSTALHLAGCTIPSQMQGRSFLGANLMAPRKYIYAGRDRMDERYDMQRCVRDHQYKYIRYYEPDKPFCQYMNTPEKGAIMQEIRRAQAMGKLPKAGIKMMAATKPVEELFNCMEDPDELNNLADDEKYRDKLEELRVAHSQWSDDTKDAGLIPETIMRNWESHSGMAIYDFLRSHSIPIEEIRRTALGEISGEELTRNLLHENEAVRYWAAIHLGNQPDMILDPQPLHSATEDPVPVVRFAAARALAKKNKISESLAILTHGLTHENEWVRLASAQILDELKALAEPAMAQMESALEDENKYVVRVVNHALNQMKGSNHVVP